MLRVRYGPSTTLCRRIHPARHRHAPSAGAGDVKILADVDVKHSAPLAARALEDEVDDLLKRGLADAIVASGAGTGKPTDPAKVRRVKLAAGHAPVYVGSGVTAQTIAQLA